jgi:hypothetical protein
MTALSIGKGVTLDSAADLEATLRRIGEVRYHNLHPFHKYNSDQGRGRDIPLPRSRHTAGMAPPHRGP